MTALSLTINGRAHGPIEVRDDLSMNALAGSMGDRARSVLLAILTAPRGWSADQPPDLPAWFVAACMPDPPSRSGDSTASADREERPPQSPPISQETSRLDSGTAWTLAGWLDWFVGERYWFWWDARVTGKTELVAEYVVYDWPAPTGSLTSLWRASGAIDVTVL